MIALFKIKICVNSIIFVISVNFENIDYRPNILYRWLADLTEKFGGTNDTLRPGGLIWCCLRRGALFFASPGRWQSNQGSR